MSVQYVSEYENPWKREDKQERQKASEAQAKKNLHEQAALEGLKPCPTCGSPARRFSFIPPHEFDSQYYVRCVGNQNVPGTSIPCRAQTKTRMDRWAADQDWNYRAAS